MRTLVIAAAVLLSTPAIAGTYTSTIRGPHGTVTTTCSSTYAGRSCFSNVIPPQDAGPRIIDVPAVQNIAPKEQEMNDAERAAKRRENGQAPEPVW